MKNYKITVNGNIYDVTVEEKAQKEELHVEMSSAVSGDPVQPPAASSSATPDANKTGNIRVEAGASGKIYKIEAIPGTQLKTGDTILVLEIMKMETPVVAPENGTLVSINVSEGQMVDAGELLATMSL